MKSVVMLVVLVASTAFAGNICTWTGSAGDGKWSTPGNWENDVKPVSGNDDWVSVWAATAGETMENDIDDLVIAHIRFTGSKQLHLTGKELCLSNETMQSVWTNDCPLVCDVPVSFAAATKSGAYYMVMGNESEFNNVITSACPRTVHVHSQVKSPKCSVHFRAPLIFSKTVALQPSGNKTMYFHEPITAGAVESSSYGDTDAGLAHLYKPVRGYSTFNASYREFVLEDTGILDPDGDLRFVGWPASGTFNLNGYDQTVRGVTGDFEYGTSNKRYPNEESRQITSAKPATLTIRANANKTCGTIVNGHVSLVYDALKSSYVQTFTHRTNQTDGVIIVSNGVFRISDGARFPNVTGVCIASGGTLEFCATNNVTEPFGTLRSLDIEEGGVLKLPEGTSVTAEKVRFAGVLQSDGQDYTSSSSGCLQGGGTVKARKSADRNVWLPDSGDWSAPSNWSLGLPSKSWASAIEAAVNRSVSATVGSDVTTAAGDFTTVAQVGGSVSLAVNAKLPFDDGIVDFGGGTDVVVAEGGTLDYTGASTDATGDTRVTFENGASLTVKDGGTANLKEFAGNVAFDGANLKIEEGGVVDVAPRCNSSTAVKGKLVLSGGTKVDVGGKLILRMGKANDSNVLLNATDADFSVHDNGAIELRPIPTSADARGCLYNFGNGTSTFSGNATIASVFTKNSWAQGINFAPSTDDGVTEVKFTGNSCISNFCGYVYVGKNSGGYAHLDMSEVEHGFYPYDQSSTVFYAVRVAYGKGTGVFDYAGSGYYSDFYGTTVGFYDSQSLGGVGTGTYNVFGGAKIKSNGATAVSRSAIGDSYKPLTGFWGTLVGCWLNAKADVSESLPWHAMRGTLRLSGNETKYENTHGHFIVGAGRAEGLYMQEDGTHELAKKPSTWGDGNYDITWISETTAVTSQTYKCWNTNNVMAVGIFGGRGTCIVSNGTFVANVRTYVGGCHTNDIFDAWNFSYGPNKWLLDEHGAEGLLRLAGGTATFGHTMFVGQDGHGTVEFGPAAAVTVPKLVLGVGDDDNSAAALRFVVGPNGYTGTVQVGTLVATDKATVTVDLTDAVFPKSTYTLMTYEALEGTLPEIEVVGRGEATQDVVVIEENGRIRVRNPRGSVVIVR